jgi:hypothetical protein
MTGKGKEESVGPGATSVASLLAARQVIRGSRLLRVNREFIPSGIPGLDRILPGHGLEKGGICELIGAGPKQRLASMCLSLHSRAGRAAYLSSAGILNPWSVLSFQGRPENLYSLVEREPRRLLWGAYQVMASALFPVVALYASHWRDGSPLVDPLSHRRFQGLAREHRLVLLLLFDEHPALGGFARPCLLRLQVEEEEIRVLKCAGGSPGLTMSLR